LGSHTTEKRWRKTNHTPLMWWGGGEGQKGTKPWQKKGEEGGGGRDEGESGESGGGVKGDVVQ